MKNERYTPEYCITFEIDFEPAGSDTIIRLREHGYHNTPSGLRAMLNWKALTLWKFYVEHDLRY